MTELDLRQSLIPVPLIEHLAKVMPRNDDGDGYDYHSFLDGVVNGDTSSNSVKTTSSVEQTGCSSGDGGGGMARRSKHYL